MINNLSLSFGNTDGLTRRICRLADRVFGVGENGDDVHFWLSVSLAFPNSKCLTLFVNALEKEFKHPFPLLQKQGGHYTQLRQLLPIIRQDIETQNKKEKMKMRYANQEDIEAVVEKVLKDFDYRPASQRLSAYDRIVEDLGMDSLDMVEIPLQLEEILEVDGISEAFEKRPPRYVTDVTQIACEALHVFYQVPVKTLHKGAWIDFWEEKFHTRV